MQGDEFLQLDVDGVIEVLSTRELSCEGLNEETFCDAALTWLRHTWPNRRKHVYQVIMNSMQTSNSVTFHFMKNSFSDISRKWILSNMIKVVPVLIIFGKIHFLLTSENELFMK